MSLVAEDGTGKSDANSFISLTDADAYHADRRNADTWDALEDEQKQAFLIEATTWINSLEFINGVPASSTQALFFPAAGAYDRNGFLLDSDAVPQQIKDATAELAYRIRETEVEADQERQVNRERVGALEVEYDPYAALSKQYPFVLRILKGLIAGEGCGELVRG